MNSARTRAIVFVAIAFLATVLVAVQAAPRARQQPARDGGTATAAPAGTATLSGTLVTDEPRPRSVRRARVMLNTVGGGPGWTTITDDAGRFAFDGVPAGRYLLTARKDAFLRASYGASRPGRTGTPIAIADGQRLTGLVFTMFRGAVLTGTVTDLAGEPATDVEVWILRRRIVRGQPVLEEDEIGRTDDRGVYRVYGLAAGDYAVAAVPGFRYSAMGSLRETGAADVQWALGQGAPGSARTASLRPSAPAFGYAPVYYPGGTSAAGATVFSVAAGEERARLDIPLQIVPVSIVEGSVVDPSGRPADGAEVYMVPLGSDASLGFADLKEASGPAFTFKGVAPGDYEVFARTNSQQPFAVNVRITGLFAPPQARPAPTPNMWAKTSVRADGHDITGLALTLQPGLTVSGRVAFDSATGRPAPATSSVHVRVDPLPGTQRLSFGTSNTTIKPDGTFEVAGLVPGQYRLTTSIEGDRPGSTPTWAVTSAFANGRDVADLPLEVSPAAALADLVVTLTDRPAELTGRLQDSTGRAAPDYFIILFPSDPAYWLPRSRRIQSVRPASDGAFVMTGLPRGEYLLAALTDVEPDEWFDPSFFESLVASAIKVALGDGEKKVQDVRIR